MSRYDGAKAVLAGDIGGTKTVLGIFGKSRDRLVPRAVKLYRAVTPQASKTLLEDFFTIIHSKSIPLVWVFAGLFPNSAAQLPIFPG